MPTRQINPGTVTIFIRDADDGVTVYRDSTVFLHAPFNASKNKSLEIQEGEEVTLDFVCHNQSGGQYYANISAIFESMEGDKKQIYKINHSGNTWPLENRAWEDTLKIVCKAT